MRFKGKGLSVETSTKKVVNPTFGNNEDQISWSNPLAGSESDEEPSSEIENQSPKRSPLGKIPRSPIELVSKPIADIRGSVMAGSSAAFDVGGAVAGTGMKVAGAGPKILAEGLDSLLFSDDSALSSDSMLDLLESFKACDLDGGGFIDIEELHVVLRTLGATVEKDDLRDLVVSSNLDYADELAQNNQVGKMLLKAISLWQVDFNGAAEVQTGDDECNFSQFVHLMGSGKLTKYFDVGWVQGSVRMRMLRMGFALADVNSDGQVYEADFKVVANMLHAGTLTEVERDRLWKKMNKSKQLGLSYTEYLEGMCLVAKDTSVKFNLMEPDLMMGLIFDMPCSAAEERQILNNMSALEKVGTGVLIKASNDFVTEDEKKALIEKHEKKQMHVVTEDKRKSLRNLHRESICVGIMIGTVTCMFLSLYEVWLIGHYGCSGTTQNEVLCADGNHSLTCEPMFLQSQANLEAFSWNYPVGSKLEGMQCKALCTEYTTQFGDIHEGDECVHFCVDGSQGEDKDELLCEEDIGLKFWFYLCISIVIQCVFEIGLLYVFAIRYAVGVTQVLQLRLSPLNRDRAFVCIAMVRSALELPNPNGVVLGVDPAASHKGKSATAQAFWTIMYKAKIGITSIVLKVIARRFLARGSARTFLPFMAVPATAIWDGFFAHLSVCEAKMRGAGFSAGMEAFDVVCDGISWQLAGNDSEAGGNESALDEFRLNCVRAVGAVICANQSLYPTKEILLRHAITHVHLIQKATDHPDDLKLDDIATFKASVKNMLPEQQKAVMTIMMIAMMLDGSISSKEALLLNNIIEVVDDSVATADGKIVQRLKLITQQFRTEMIFEPEEVGNCIQSSADDRFSLPGSYFASEICAALTRAVTC